MTAGLKILFLGEPDSPNTISWVDGLEKLGCEIVIASARSDGSNGAVPIGPQSLPPRLRILLGVSDVKKLIKEHKPDLMIAYRVTSYGSLAARTGFHPLVMAAQNEQIVYSPTPSFIRNKLVGFFVKYALKRPDLIHAWGDNIRQGLLKYGADDRRIMVMHRGIDLNLFKPEKKELNQERPVFISTRTLAPEYRIDHIINSFSILLRDISSAKLNIIGTGSEKEKLQEQVKELNISESVIFHGRMAPEEVVKKLHEADFYISAIQTEGISSSLLEACACGVFPIVADMPASRCIIEDGKNGILIPDLSPEELAEKLKEAVGNKELVGKAFEYNNEIIREKFDRERNLKEFVNRYRELLNK